MQKDQQLFGDPLSLHESSQVEQAISLPMLVGLSSAMFSGKAAVADYLPGLDPKDFQPVCSASDSFYRVSQALVVAAVGQENYKEFAPLVAQGLLRVRLELCVLESFLYEAILPFIKEKGVSWVLPLHETPETFLAGVVFAIAANFVLVGSSKILYIIVALVDAFVGFPFRSFGGLGWRGLEDKAIEMNRKRKEELGIEEKKPPWWRGLKPREKTALEDVVAANSGSQVELANLALWGAFFGLGTASKGIRQVTEKLDSFVGRDLILASTVYVAIKFAHFKLFPDILDSL